MMEGRLKTEILLLFTFVKKLHDGIDDSPNLRSLIETQLVQRVTLPLQK